MMETPSKRSITGLVQYEPIEAGIWYLQDADDVNWTPVNFPEDLKKVGLKVSLSAVETNTVSFAMFGIPIQIIDYKIVK